MAIKDSARVLYGQPGYPVADRITKAMPAPVLGRDIPLAGIFDESHRRYAEATEVRALYEADSQVKEIIDTARGLEGLKRQWGVYAAGVIMSSEPLIEVRALHPELAEPLAGILDETFGLIVYQEQVMAIAQRVAGYSLSKADLLRRAMGKKKKEILDKEYETFSAGCVTPVTRQPRSRRCGTSCSHSPTTPSTVRTPPLTGWSPIGPPT